MRYQLQEAPSSGYPQRTEWNVRDSDGTVIFSIAPVLTGGSKQTVTRASKEPEIASFVREVLDKIFA